MLTLPSGKRDLAALRKQVHPAYAAHQTSWQIFLDAYDGEGGFLDGTYLWQYPREDTRKFETRCSQARYHNYVETIVDLYVRKIFAQKPKRTTANADLEAWWTNVDGAGTAINDFIKEALARALASGHVGILVDKTPDAPTGPSKADERAQVYATRYLPASILDWRITRDETLVGVKLQEAVEADSITEPLPDEDAANLLIWDRDQWVRIPAGKDPVVDGPLEHNLGLVPLAVLRPKRSKRWPFIGKSLLGNANVLRAIFNRQSEEDEVLRDQAFSLFVVQVPPEGDVETIKKELGGSIGTTQALVTKGTADFKTADMQVPKTIRESIAYLVQEIYRMAHMRFTRDSLEAETAEALQLKHDELNDMLVGIVDELIRVEVQLARFWCGWNAPTEQQAAQMFEAAKVEIGYARKFFLGDLESELRAWVMAIREDLGKTMTARIKKRMAHRVDPDMDEATQKVVEGEIDAMDEPGQHGDAGSLEAELMRRRGAQRLQDAIVARHSESRDGEGEGAAA